MDASILLRRGDSWQLDRVVTRDGTTPVDLTGAVALLTFVDSVGLRTSELRARGVATDAAAGKVTFSLQPYQTAALQVGSYRYDIQVSLPGGEVLTPFEGTALVSEDVTQVLPPLADAAVARAQARFVGPDGVPVRQRIVVSAAAPLAKSGNYLITSGTPLVYEADDTGSLEITLIRGSKVRVAIEGTNLIREFTVPDQETFDLLQAMTDAPDPFTVQTTPPFLVRRSL